MLESPRGNWLHYDDWSFWCAVELHLSVFWQDFVHQGYWSRVFLLLPGNRVIFITQNQVQRVSFPLIHWISFKRIEVGTVKCLVKFNSEVIQSWGFCFGTL